MLQASKNLVGRTVCHPAHPPGARRPLVVVAVYLASWLALDFAVENVKGALEVSVWYPPAGLSVALLLIFGARYAPAMVLAGLMHLLLFRGGADYPPALLLGIPLVYATVYAGAALLLLRGMKFDPRLVRARDVVRFVGVACLAAPLLANAAAVAGYALAGFVPWSDFLANALGSWAGEATGVGVLAPVLLVALRRFPALWADAPQGPPERPEIEGFRLPARREVPEFLAQAALLGLAVFVAYGGSRSVDLDYAYLVFVPLIWVAVRWGFAHATAAVLLVNAGAVVLVGGPAAGPNAILLQFGLTTITLVSLLLGALVSERRRTAERLVREASRDRLTGLPGRGPFLDLVAQRSGHRSPGKPGGGSYAGGRDGVRGAGRAGFAVLVVDMDGFGAVNNTLGHEVGDEVLVAVAGRLFEFAGTNGLAARIAGDRFALVAEGGDAPAAAERLAEELLEKLLRPYEIRGREINLTAGVGVALGRAEVGRTGAATYAEEKARAEPHGRSRSPEELLREADTALDRAKARGRSRYAVFDRAMGEEVAARLKTEGNLRRALRAGEFVLHYQPVLSTGMAREVVGAEALVRWRHPERGLLAPEAFVPLAEETDLIVPLGLWVLREALRDARSWGGAAGSTTPWVAVNVSARQARRSGFAEEVERVLRESGFPPERLKLELTESAWIEEAEAVGSALVRLAEAGVAIAVDDFGTGYSPLSNLKGHPVSTLKIDRSFVSGLPLSVVDAAVVEAVVTMAYKMGLEVVGEGVETEEQLAFLRSVGCGLAQGFLMGPPMPADAFAKFLEAPHGPGGA